MFNFDYVREGSLGLMAKASLGADGEGSLLTYGALCCSQTKKCTVQHR